MGKERFLVTGAAGFVGSCLARRLVENREDVTVLLKPETNAWRIRDIQKKIHIVKGNLANQQLVSKFIRKTKPTVIYHLATHGAYSSQDNAQKILMTNVLGTWHLLNACRDIDYKLFVNTGSSSEYGFKSKPMKETDLLEPNSYYAVAKSAQTLLCQHVARSQKRPIVTFRLFSVYGYYEEPSRLIPTLIRRCLTGKDLEMVSPKTARDFIFVDDVVDAYLKIAPLSRLRGEAVNIGTGKQTKLKEVVDTTLDLTRAKVKVNWGGMKARIWDSNIWIADTKEYRKILGWKPKVSLKEGLAKTIRWFKRAPKEYFK